MTTGSLGDELVRLHDLDAAWRTSSAGPRLSAVRAAAVRVRETIVGGPRCLAVRTMPLRTLLYPTKFAFWGAATVPSPYVKMVHRSLLVQFLQRGVPKTLLWNPTDLKAAQNTPYFRPTIDALGEYLALEVLTKSFEPLETQLAEHGLSPRDIDYVAFDHFHTQDLRSLLGTTDGAHSSRFPRAALIAPRNEWDAWDDLHPVQRAWFIAEGKRNVDTSRVILTDGDLQLGDGVWIFRTPGHTVGNQTIFMNTREGIWGSSENGTCADSWSPHGSRIPGLARAARIQQVDFILNTNTPEWMGDQYTSMMLERTLVDRSHRAPSFVQMLSSSEIEPSVLAPGVRPTLLHRSIESGTVVLPLAERGARSRTPIDAARIPPTSPHAV